MLADINDFRTGEDAWYLNSDNITKTYCTNLNPLVYDYDLEKVAMQRAAEIALSWGHTRPDGSSTWTAYDDYGYEMWGAGENIAAGYNNAKKNIFSVDGPVTYYNSISNISAHKGNVLITYSCQVNGHPYWKLIYMDKNGKNKIVLEERPAAG